MVSIWNGIGQKLIDIFTGVSCEVLSVLELPQEAETIMISEIIMKLVKRYFPFIVTTAFFETFFLGNERK